MHEMKDSGNMWIGATPETWKMIPLKYLASYNDEVLSENTDDEFEFDYIEIGSVQYGRGIIYTEHMKFKNAPSRARRIVRKDDIIVSTVRTYLKAVATIPACNNSLIASTGFIVIRPHKVLPRFMNYALLSESFISLVESHSTGISYPAINSVDVVKFKIPVPCRSEQERIAAFLNAECAEIDAVLGKTRASIEEYKKLKQAVITQAVTKGIFDKQIYPHNVKLKYLLYIASGDAIRNEELSEVGKYPAYGGGESLGFASKYNTLENSLIVGRVGARCGCVTYIDSKAWATDNALIVHPICNPRYMYYMLIYSQLNNLNTSNAQPLITATKIKNVVVPYFLEDTCQRKIVDFLDEKCACIDAIIEKKQQYLTEIENYKKSLIYEYVTGKKEVV